MTDSIAFSGQMYQRQGVRGAPVFSYLNYTLGDMDGGGQSIVLYGQRLFNASVELDGTPATVTSTTQTTCTFTLPAHTPGLVTLSITNRDGTTNVGEAFEYWSPSNDPDIYDYLDSNKHVTETPTGASAVCDTYSSANQNTGRTIRGGAEQTSMAGQSFTGDGRYVSSARFFLKKVGAPSGVLTAYIYSHTGEFGDGTSGRADQLLATSDTMDVSTLTTSYVDYDFSFTDTEQIKLENGVHYVALVEYTTGNGSNNVTVGSDSTGEHAGNSCYFAGAFFRSSDDICFRVMTQAGSGVVRTWTDETYGDAYTQTVDVNRPTVVSNVFGTLPAIRFTPLQWLTGIYQDMSSTGMSVFAVAAWTSSDSSFDNDANPPLTIVGSTNSDGGFGANAGQVESKHWDGDYRIVDGGSGLNDGGVRLIGATHDTVTNTAIYVGDQQQGSIDTGPALGSASYDTIGTGYNNVDGWSGDLGAVLVYSGAITGDSIINLNRWARQRFGTP